MLLTLSQKASINGQPTLRNCIAAKILSVHLVFFRVLLNKHVTLLTASKKLPSKNSGTLMKCAHMNERQANHGVAWSNEKRKENTTCPDCWA